MLFVYKKTIKKYLFSSFEKIFVCTYVLGCIGVPRFHVAL